MKTKILCLLSLFEFAHAAPTLYPADIDLVSTIENTTNSNLIADSHDINRVYVMPPSSGYSNVSGLHTILANVGFCKQMAELQEYSRNASKRINELSKTEIQKYDEFNKLQDQLLIERQELSKFASTNNLETIMLLDDRIAELEIRINEIISSELNQCEQNCNDLRAEYKELSSQRRTLMADRRDIVKDNLIIARQYEKMKQKTEAFEKHITAKKAEYDDLKTRLTALRTQHIDLYKDFSQMEGARASINFTSSWDKNVETLRQQNPGLRFEKIETRDALISSSIIDLGSIPTGGAILDYNIGGEKQGQMVKLRSYPENFHGNVILSLVGTCPALHPTYFDINIPNGTDEMKYGLTVSYEYPSIFNADVSITYNMHKMYQKIVTSTSKGGGFFRRRRSTTSIEEKNYFKDSFKVKWIDGIGLTDTEKADKEMEMRDRVFMRLAAIGIPYVVSSGELKLPEPPKSGALVLSQGLMKTCPGNKICMGVALASDFLDSLFGSATATTSYKNLLDIDMEENWSKTEVVWRPWVTTYN